MKKILIITPLFHTEASGASIYYKFLSKKLSEQDYSVSIISDNESGEHSYIEKYIPLFLSRSARDKNIFDYLRYLHQNIMYLLLPFYISFGKYDTVIIHSSFYNIIGIFGISIYFSKLLSPKINYILDVRDNLYKKNRYFSRYAKIYSSVIACSKSIYNDLSTTIKNTVYIPVINIEIDKSTLSRRNNTKYILYVGAIKEQKGVDLLYEGFLIFNKKHPEYQLKLVGPYKTHTKKYLSGDNIEYLGKLPQSDVLNLMYNCELLVFVSRNEGMPRVCLEALSLGKKIVLPSGILEFEEEIPQYIFRNDNPQDLSNFIDELINSPFNNTYDMSKHDSKNVIQKYLELM